MSLKLNGEGKNKALSLLFYYILLLLSSFIYFYTNKIQSPFDIIKFYMKKVRQKNKVRKIHQKNWGSSVLKFKIL